MKKFDWLNERNKKNGQPAIRATQKPTLKLI